MFEVQRGRGRVVLARVRKLTTVADVDAYAAAFTKLRLTELEAPVLCADHRPVAIYPQPVTTKLISLFTGLNVLWSRAALLIAPSNAMLSLQLDRVVRDAQNPSRRVFQAPAQGIAFLAEVCTEDETACIREFLAGYK